MVCPLEAANCCGFAFQQPCNKIYATFLEVMPIRNPIKVDILLISNFLSNTQIELLYLRKKQMIHAF
jgi:hypothetical protein